jgi:NAD(P)-dependent dehydrogenase (short-subunit alcohol dehydrogenase family)
LESVNIMETNIAIVYFSGYGHWTTDLKDRHIRSNVVSPGPINTSLASRQSADVIARIVSTVPMGRMGEPDEIAKAALFLASDDSSFVTGIELFVDGGRAQV